MVEGTGFLSRLIRFEGRGVIERSRPAVALRVGEDEPEVRRRRRGGPNIHRSDLGLPQHRHTGTWYFSCTIQSVAKVTTYMCT